MNTSWTDPLVIATLLLTVATLVAPTGKALLAALLNWFRRRR